MAMTGDGVNDVLALKKAESQLERYTETLKDSEELYKQKFLTKIELENDRFNKLASDLDQKKAQLAQDVLEKYTIPMGLKEKESAVAEAVCDLIVHDSERTELKGESVRKLYAARSRGPEEHKQ